MQLPSGSWRYDMSNCTESPLAWTLFCLHNCCQVGSQNSAVIIVMMMMMMMMMIDDFDDDFDDNKSTLSSLEPLLRAANFCQTPKLPVGGKGRKGTARKRRLREVDLPEMLCGCLWPAVLGSWEYSQTYESILYVFCSFDSGFKVVL